MTSRVSVLSYLFRKPADYVTTLVHARAQGLEGGHIAGTFVWGANLKNPGTLTLKHSMNLRLFGIRQTS